MSKKDKERKSCWHYQMTKFTHPPNKVNGEVYVEYAIKEAYVNDAGEIHALTETAVDLSGDSPEDLYSILGMIFKDVLGYGVVDEDTLVYGESPWGKDDEQIPYEDLRG